MNVRALLWCLLILPSAAPPPQKSPIFTLMQTIPIPDVRGRIDHMAIDVTGKRLFVAALGNNSVEVIDLEHGKTIHTIPDVKEPQDVAYMPDANALAVSSGKDGTVHFYDGRSLRRVARLDLGEDADNIRYNAGRKLLYVAYGKGGIALIDPVLRVRLGEITFTSHPESFQFEGKSSNLYVNLPASRSIAVIDAVRGILRRKIALQDASANFPMAIDGNDWRLFIGCRNPPRLLVYDTATDSLITGLAIDRDCDDIFYNEKTKEIYISCGEGFLDVVHAVTPEAYVLTARIRTSPGARTALFVPQRQELFLASPHHGAAPAAIRVYARRQ